MLAKKVAWIAGGAIGALAIAYPFTISAQSAADDQQGPPPQQGQGGGGFRGGQGGQGGPGGAPGEPGPRGGAFGGQRPGMMVGGMGGGGGTAMVDDNTHLYIFSGGSVYKVAKSDLKVDRKAQVIEMQPPMDMAPRSGGVGGYSGGSPRGGVPEENPTID